MVEELDGLFLLKKKLLMLLMKRKKRWMGLMSKRQGFRCGLWERMEGDGLCPLVRWREHCGHWKAARLVLKKTSHRPLHAKEKEMKSKKIEMEKGKGIGVFVWEERGGKKKAGLRGRARVLRWRRNSVCSDPSSRSETETLDRDA